MARAGRWPLAVRKGKRGRQALQGRRRGGRNALKRKIKLRPGGYRLVLTREAGAATTTDTAKLRVTRPG